MVDTYIESRMCACGRDYAVQVSRKGFAVGYFDAQGIFNVLDKNIQLRSNALRICADYAIAFINGEFYHG